MFFTEEQIGSLLKLVQKRIPRWDSFSNKYFVHEEIEYKKEAIELTNKLINVDEFQRLIDEKNFDEIGKRLERIGQSTNLLFLSMPKTGDLRILYQQSLRPNSFFIELKELLFGVAPSPDRLARYGEYISKEDLPNNWTFPTYFLFLCHPDSEIFVKPRVVKWLLNFIGQGDQYKGVPDPGCYRLLLSVFQDLRKQLEKYGPHDMVDLQSFIWIAYSEFMMKKSIDQKPSEETQIWAIAPGNQAMFWSDCKERGEVYIGWNKMGDLNQFQSKDQILAKLMEVNPGEGLPNNDALTLWDFSHVMKQGDILVAKKGNRKIVGVGVVQGDYGFDNDRPSYRHVRDVEWLLAGEWVLPDGDKFANKTLTNITKYSDFVEKIFDVTGFKPDLIPSKRFYWLNCVPHHSQISKSRIGEEHTFNTRDEHGNRYEIYSCFKALKQNDLLIAFEMMPVQKVTTILEIVQGVHESEAGECIRFRVKEKLKNSKSLDSLQDDPRLADCVPVSGSRQGTLFKISQIEFEAIVDGVTTPIIDLPPYLIEDALEGLFIDERNFRDWLRLWKNSKNLILQGPPGVGKTFVAKRLAYALMEEKDPQRVMMVQFHQSYSYEDFVQGFRPGKDGFVIKDGIFFEFCQKAKSDPRPHVFIVDEINRGNLSRIFGELLMLIESDKRGEHYSMRLAYQQEGQSFYVPANVFILGMMNTADRSLAVVDYALRRRFQFADLRPAFEMEAFHEHLGEACEAELARRIIQRMMALNAEIEKDTTNLGRGFCVGHSYFCGVKSEEDYIDVVRFQIAPLLSEYWFDNPKKAEEQIEYLLG